jgi:succinate dehydrogenase/fumarate reductase cytochrome b subunit
MNHDGIGFIFYLHMSHLTLSLAFILQVCVSFPIVYHYLGAVRHTAWDYVPGYLENTDVEKSSYILFGSASVISLGTMFL